MPANTIIDKQITNYLSYLDIKQKKAVLNVVKTFAEKHSENEAWDEEGYVKEMNKRFRDYETGKVKTFTLDEVEKRARQAYKFKKIK